VNKITFGVFTRASFHALGGGGFALLSFFLFTPAKNMKLSHGELHKTDESFPVLYS
jgi:hypothetical protein